jgi:hypothetical protein
MNGEIIKQTGLQLKQAFQGYQKNKKACWFHAAGFFV